MSENGDWSATGPVDPAGQGEQGQQRQRSFGWQQARARIANILSTAVSWFGSIAAGLLFIYVILALGNANPENEITRFVAMWARPLVLGFEDLFQPGQPQAAIMLNYGAAAVFWLIVTSVAARIIRAVGGTSRTY